MAFRGPSSYLVVIDAFLRHWEAVDGALLAPIVLPGPYGRGELQADRDELASRIAALQGATNVLQGRRTDRRLREPRLRERMRQLRGCVAGQLAESAFAGQAPLLPQAESAPGLWMEAFDAFSHLWHSIEAAPPPGFVPPLLLSGGYAVGDFDSDGAALRALYTALTEAEQDAARAVAARQEVYRRVRVQLVRYRLAVSGYFERNAPLLLSTPKLTPPRPPRKRKVEVVEEPASAG